MIGCFSEPWIRLWMFHDLSVSPFLGPGSPGSPESLPDVLRGPIQPGIVGTRSPWAMVKLLPHLKNMSTCLRRFVPHVATR